MSKPDLTYLDGGLFVTFFAETPAGESAWEELARHSEGSGRFLSTQLPSVLAQLRAAGFTVHKARPRKPLSARELDAMLAEIEGLSS